MVTQRALALLLGLALLAGLGLGWILHDLSVRVPPPLAAAPTPTLTIEPYVPSVTPTQIWTPAVPTEAPTLTPSPPPTPAPPTEAPTLTPSPPPIPTPIPTPPPSADPALPIVGYAAHTVAAGETLAQIAQLGGSSPELIASYNRLRGEPAPGRTLIVPQLEGRTSQLQNPPTLIERGPATDRVALTLDAGAGSAPTPRMLAALRERQLRITFFLTGRWIRENPDLVRQIVADGHEVANHTTTHPDLRQLSDAEIRQELADTEAAMREVAGAGARPLFRPPFGAYDERVLRVVQAEGYLPIYWTLDSLDSVGEPKTAAFLVERVTAKLTREQLRGAIILAHCGSEPTADALPEILDRLAAMGLQVAPLSEVLSGG